VTRLLLDAMCGGVRAQLRMCGHDAAFALERDLEDDEALLRTAREEDRILVTRNRRLADRAEAALLLEEKDPAAQLAELSDAGIDLSLTEEPERCGRCNGTLVPVDADASAPDYAPDPADEPVRVCEDCGQHFWRGSHWERVAEALSDLE